MSSFITSARNIKSRISTAIKKRTDRARGTSTTKSKRSDPGVKPGAASSPADAIQIEAPKVPAKTPSRSQSKPKAAASNSQSITISKPQPTAKKISAPVPEVLTPFPIKAEQRSSDTPNSEPGTLRRPTILSILRMSTPSIGNRESTTPEERKSIGSSVSPPPIRVTIADDQGEAKRGSTSTNGSLVDGKPESEASIRLKSLDPPDYCVKFPTLKTQESNVALMAPRRPPPKRAVPKPAMYYLSSRGQVRRVYTNRCEKYCMGPVTVLVEAVGMIVLALINLLLLAISVTLIAVGGIIRNKADPYDEYLGNFKKKFDESIKDLGLTHPTSFDEVESKMEMLALPLMCFGGGMAFMSFIGLCGAVFGIQSMLDMYSRICGLILLLEFSLFLFIYDGEPDLWKYELQKSLDGYTGIEGTNSVTKMWNQAMNYLNCCGVNNFMDFQRRKNWPPENIKGITYDLLTPVFCCKSKAKGNFTCALKGVANPDNNNMENGCYMILYNKIFKNTYTMGVFLTLMGLQVIVLFFSNWLHWSAGMRVVDKNVIQRVKAQAGRGP